MKNQRVKNKVCSLIELCEETTKEISELEQVKRLVNWNKLIIRSLVSEPTSHNYRHT